MGLLRATKKDLAGHMPCVGPPWFSGFCQNKSPRPGGKYFNSGLDCVGKVVENAQTSSVMQ